MNLSKSSSLCFSIASNFNCSKANSLSVWSSTLSASALFILSWIASIAAILCASLSLNTFAAAVDALAFFFSFFIKSSVLIPLALITSLRASFSSSSCFNLSLVFFSAVSAANASLLALAALLIAPSCNLKSFPASMAADFSFTFIDFSLNLNASASNLASSLKASNLLFVMSTNCSSDAKSIIFFSKALLASF